jgi:L-iditol 2-dehydrogenase
MLSIQLIAPHTLEPREMPMPADPGPGEVLVKVRAVGICGSDLHWYQDGRIGPTQAEYPQILGHEPAGDVVAVGAGVTGPKPGDRVLIEPALNCGTCELCMSGRHNACIRSQFMGGPGTLGLLREFALVPQHNLVHIPDTLTYVQGTVVEPLAVAVHVLRMSKIRLGATVAVIGAGPIGLLCAAVARTAGASEIFIADKVAHRVRMGKKMGADVAVHVPSESLHDVVMDRTRGRGVDVVIDAAGDSSTFNTGLSIARFGGQYMLVGLPVEHEMKLDLHLAMGKELNIQTMRRSNHTAHEAIELIAAGKISDALVTHRTPLAHTGEVFQVLDNYSEDVGKVVIEM